MKRITNGFDKLSLAEFRQKLDFIVSKMTGNPNFPDQQPAVQALATAATAYKLLDEAAERGSEEDRLKRDAAWEQLIEDLHALGLFVTAVANKNVEKLASSGFNYTQPRKTTPDLPKPVPPILEAGLNPGDIYCRTSRKAGMTGVNFYHTTNTDLLGVQDGTGWDVVSTNKVKVTLSGLTSGQRYYVKVALIGVRGQEVFSDVVSYIPQ